MSNENVNVEETVEETAEEKIVEETVDEAAANTEETVEGADEGQENSSEEGTVEESDGEEPSAKKIFGRKNKKDPRDEKIEELTDKVKRQLAEFENFRHRSEKEKSAMYDMGAKAVVEKILPIIDNFERGLEHAPEDGEAKAFTDGMRMVYKQMLSELENVGVKPIEAVGQPFDPNIHNAVMQVESEEYESGTVVQELQKGYMLRDSLVRPSMVSVAQ